MSKIIVIGIFALLSIHYGTSIKLREFEVEYDSWHPGSAQLVTPLTDGELNEKFNVIFIVRNPVAMIHFQLTFDVDYDGVLTVHLWHSMSYGPGEPQDIIQDRGNITVQSIQTGSVALSQAALKPEDIANLQHLAKLDGFYRLRATVHTSDEKEKNFLSFVKACALVESHLSDVVTLTFDHSGSVIAVSLSAPYVVCEGTPVHSQNLRFFNTTVQVRHMEPGPIPDTATYIQKVEREKEAKERGEVKDNRSFLAKYWMYIVPMLIFMLLSSFGTPEAGGGR